MNGLGRTTSPWNRPLATRGRSPADPSYAPKARVALVKLAAPFIAVALTLGGACRKPDQPVDPSLVCATPGRGSAIYDYAAGAGVSTPEEAVRNWIGWPSTTKGRKFNTRAHRSRNTPLASPYMSGTRRSSKESPSRLKYRNLAQLSELDGWLMDRASVAESINDPV